MIENCAWLKCHVREKEISLFILLNNKYSLSCGIGRREAASPLFFSLSLSSFFERLSRHITTIPHARTRIVTHAFQGFWGCTWVERVPTFSARKRSLPKGTHARDDPAVWSLPRAPFLSRCWGGGSLTASAFTQFFPRFFSFESLARSR